jgi:uncharacterized repeat protein (TIGR04138 family)
MPASQHLAEPPMPTNEVTRKTLEQVVHECGRYPIEAFEFVRHGLNHTVEQIHGERVDPKNDPDAEEKSFHVTGQQLSWGLRNYAVLRYGIMAAAVLAHWQITRTNDFGNIVFAMVNSKLMGKTDDDDIRDFHGVFDFAAAFNPPARPAAPSKPVFQL